MAYTPQINANTLTMYLGICGTGRATADSTTLSNVAFGTVYAPNPGVTFEPDDVGMPIAIVGGGPVDPLMPAPYFVQGALFHTTIASYVSPTEVTLTDAPDTSIYNTGFATIILYRPCPFASDVATNPPLPFQYNSSIAPGTADTMQCTIFNTLGGVDNPYVDRFGAINLGQPVYLTSSDDTVGDIFGGYIDTLTANSLPGVNGVYCWSMIATSWTGLAKRRAVPPTIPQTFTGVDGDVVFKTIVLQYLSNDGVAVTAETAPAITLACAVGANVGQLLDQVVSLISTPDTAWYWTTDPWRTFILGTRTGTAAPWDITDGSDLFAGDTPYMQSIVSTHNQMANQVYALGSAVLLNTLNASLSGNGSARTFNLPAPVGAAPTVTLNGGPQTVGVLGVDTGDDWYWSQGSAVITQDSGGTILASTDTLLVSYNPESPAVAQAPNATSLQQLQAIEGTSAEYDYSFTVSAPILPDDLLSLAEAYEIEYGEPAQTCQFYTLRPGLAVGQLQSITLADAGIDGTFLIATIQLTTLDNVLVWQYTAFAGANIGNAITALTQFINRQQPGGATIVTPTAAITSGSAAAPVPGQNVIGGISIGPATFPSDVTIGNLLVLVAERNDVLGNPPAVTDSQSNTWTQAVWAQTGGGFPNQIAILYTFASTSGPCTVNCPSAQWYGLMEFSGIDKSSTVVTTGDNITTAPTVTLPTDNLLVVTGLANLTGAPTVTSPEVLLGYELNAAQPGLAYSYDIPPSGSFTSSLLAAGASSATIYATVAFQQNQASSPPAQTTDVVANATGTVTNSTGALTSGLPVIGNGGNDVKVGVAGQLVPSGGTTGQVLSKNSGTNYDTGWTSPGGLSVTTKGDLQGFSTVPARVPVGTDGLVLTADSTNANGVSWQAGGGGGGGTVPTSGWTAINGIVWNDFLTPALLSYQCPNNGSTLEWRLITQPLTVPYTLIVSIRTLALFDASSQAVGLYLTDGTKLIAFEVLWQGGALSALRVERLNTVSSDDTTVAGPTSNLTSLVLSLKITNDGTNRTFYYYAAGAWVQFYQEASGSWLTETAAGPGGISIVSANNGYFVAGELIAWSLS